MTRMNACFAMIAATLLILTGAFGCEDNPEECFSSSDCAKSLACRNTYYHNGDVSGGYCVVKCNNDKDCPDSCSCQSQKGDKFGAYCMDKSGKVCLPSAEDGGESD